VRTVPFPRSGPRPAIAIPWGDLATAVGPRRGRAGEFRGGDHRGTGGHRFTAEAALACVRRVHAGIPPGAWTPSLAFGADFAASLPGVTVQV
jgi:hypothetical protein